jgi:hypothetical protein
MVSQPIEGRDAPLLIQDGDYYRREAQKLRAAMMVIADNIALMHLANVVRHYDALAVHADRQLKLTA